ncbi:dTDP-4-dehydrorhamnose reductase [Streptomyces sp. NPDC086023]|uniref:dTDP-4-dehydrorhamnose reductase n=1 Tax=Streptomyces sp. NPDC086023 TaxID=3365746 RepID=UPI0037D1E0EE
MRWLVTGAGGMLGRDLVGLLRARNHDVTAATRADLDICDASAALRCVAGHDVVVNAAAWTDVDGSEGNEAAATSVNGGGVGNLARACGTHDAKLIQVSTDYVFSGEHVPGRNTAYAEDSPTGPVNAYGRSKLAGERAVAELLPHSGYVVRTSWLYAGHGRNFATTMLDLAARQETVQVVTDQRGHPTWSGVLADRLAEAGARAIAGALPPGTYHGTGTGHTTWFELARVIFELSGLDPERVRPTTSGALGRPARRPERSVMSQDRWRTAGLAPLPPWRDQLAAALQTPDFARRSALARRSLPHGTGRVVRKDSRCTSGSQ